MMTTTYKRLLLLAALPAFLLASCSREEMGGEQDTQNGAIRFEIGFAPQTEPHTRVATDTQFNSTWEEGDEIGIYAVKHGTELAASGNYIHNVKLTYTGGSWTVAEDLYWPVGSTKLDFYAYHPYDASTTDPTAITFNVQADQKATTGAKSNYNLSDLLMAKADNSGNGFDKGETVQLSFTHALAMVQVDVSKSMIGNYDSKAPTVWLNGCTTGGVLNLSTQSATPPTNVASPVKMYPCPNDGGAPGIFAYRALVPVQTIARGTAMFRFEYDGGTLLRSKPLAESLSLVAGRVEKFDMTFTSATANVSFNVRLNELFTKEELDRITHLKVMGEMNWEDFNTIKEQMPAITSLDLGEATVVGELPLTVVITAIEGDAIPKDCFKDKNSLQEFIFPRNINAIGSGAFKNCTRLTGTLTIPAGVTVIFDEAFGNCTGLTGPLIIPDGVSFIVVRAFQNCRGFTSLTIPASVATIGYLTFGGCTGLTSITCHIQNPVGERYASDIFEGVSKDIPLYVPKGTEEVYKITPPWSDFNDIRPIL